jgi:hypothetical protein
MKYSNANSIVNYTVKGFIKLAPDFVILRLVYNFEVFAKNICDNSSGCTCLGYLLQCNTNRKEASLAAASV